MQARQPAQVEANFAGALQAAPQVDGAVAGIDDLAFNQRGAGGEPCGGNR